jgi:predicted PurR-regulated permease PerM
MQTDAAGPGNGSKNVQIRVAFPTLLKIAFFALLVISVIKLWTVILMFTVAVLLAVMLDPLAGILERRGMRRGIAIALIALLLFGFLIAFVVVVLPLTAKEILQLGRDFPRILQRITSESPRLKSAVDSVMSGARTSPLVKEWIARAPMAGLFAADGLVAIVLIFVITIYLLVEGRQMFEWLIAFAPARQRSRILRTASESRQVVLAYMRGQLFNCCLCSSVALTALLLLHVPAALPLAVLTFMCDIVPVVGTIVMTIPAVLLALLVSPTAALIIFAVYLGYHLTESYFIIPRVYGKQMRLSTLTVLLAVTAGGALQGPIGAVLVLPFVAAYPIVEKIWLKDQLPEDTVEKHGD